jgi:Tol biopolymer transport system component
MPLQNTCYSGAAKGGADLPRVATLFLLTLLVIATLCVGDFGRANASGGERIVFTHFAGSLAHLETMASDGTGAVQITSGTEYAADPAWSPDRTKIAFSRSVSGINSASHIWVVDANGDHLVQLTNGPGRDFEPSWSPDGTKISFANDGDSDFEIYTMRADGTNVTRLTNNTFSDESPRWSPDGSKILFVSARPSVRMLYIMNPDGSDQTQLADVEAFEPDWSPDGSKIAFTGTTNVLRELVCVMDSGGANVSCLTDPQQDNFLPTWSPDGQMIAFDSGRNEEESGLEIFRMNADGSSQTQLTTTIGSPDPNHTSDLSPDWGGLAPVPTPTPSPIPVGGSAILTVSSGGAGSMSPIWLVAILVALAALLAGAVVSYRRFARPI